MDVSACESVRRHQEFQGLKESLEARNDLFRALGEVGFPRFTAQISTAAIVFSKEGAPLCFLFNPQFWDELPAYDREFVLCHEMLHVVLNHGFRCIGLPDPETANKAADIVVNQLLVEKFGFHRELLVHWQDYCWFDTLLGGSPSMGPQPSLTMEECYGLLEKDGGGGYGILVDSHIFGRNPEGSLSNRRLAAEVGACLAKEGPELAARARDLLGREGMAQAGSHSLGAWCWTSIEAAPRVRWEDVIRRRLARAQPKPEPTWADVDRRHGAGGLELPAIQECRPVRSTSSRQNCVLFIDASGSALQFAGAFFALARTLPRDQFDLTLCSFDAAVYQLDPKKPEIRGGGGTSFAALESWIRIQTKSGLMTYPDSIVVLTDGEGDLIEPLHPERWHWLLTAPYRKFVPPTSFSLVLPRLG